MYASALVWERKPSEMCIEIYKKKTWKNILNITTTTWSMIIKFQ